MENDKFGKLLGDAREIVEKAIAEGRPMTEDERNKSQNMVAEAKQGYDDIALVAKINELEVAAVKGTDKKVAEVKGSGDFGRDFVESSEFKAWMKQVAPNGHIPESSKGLSSPSVPVNLGFGTKTVVTGLSDTSAGAFVQPDITGLYEPMAKGQLTLLDLVSRRQTGSDLIEYVRQTKRITEALPVLEATDLATGLKPEGAMTLLKVTAPVETIAVWVPVTKRAVADAGQLRGIIDQELREAIIEELESQILSGTGVSPELAGISGTVGILTQAFATNVLTTTRKAITNLAVNGRENPTGFVMHPNDWEAAELALFAAAPYLPYQKSLWRVPVVESFDMTAGIGYLANWKKAVLWDRQQATISMSDSHSDFFVRNLIAVLAELRAAFGVIKPTAFVKMTLAGV